LLEQRRPALLHFWFGTLGPMRRHLSPALLEAYQHWCERGDTAVLSQAVERARNHWQSLVDDLLGYHRRGRMPDVVAMIESRPF
jgi:hypothetical protein